MSRANVALLERTNAWCGERPAGGLRTGTGVVREEERREKREASCPFPWFYVQVKKNSIIVPNDHQRFPPTLPMLCASCAVPADARLASQMSRAASRAASHERANLPLPPFRIVWPAPAAARAGARDTVTRRSPPTAGTEFLPQCA